ncbi:MAG: nuclear transport factor 2 family protein [Ginsengibacter sp.]
MKTYLLIICMLIAATSYAQTKDEVIIRKNLSNQVTAWNNGEIEKFMQGYWQNDSLKFIGHSGLTYGWRQTLENYKKNYPDTAAMGKLAFDLLEVKQLSSVYFFVVGKWQLTRSIGDVRGHFSLLLKKINDRWVIVADHSS